MNHFVSVALIALFAGCQSENPAQKVEEKSFIELGGEEQYVEMTGGSSTNPVLLFIHGGPGWPQTPQLRYFNSDLSKDFIVVAWDQPGCGQSFMKNPRSGHLSIRQIIEDAHELTQILKKKFAQDKIYLAGYSWGSIVGLHLAQQYPEDYRTYVGIGQVIHMRRGIELSRQWLTEKATEKGDSETLAALSRLAEKDSSFCRSELDCFLKQYELIRKYGGATHNPQAETEEEKAMVLYEDYRSYDWYKGFEFSAQRLEKDMFDTDLTFIRKLELPALFLEGRHDWNVPSVLTEQFMEALEAPKKELVWFEDSGHGLLYEEADRFNSILAQKLPK